MDEFKKLTLNIRKSSALLIRPKVPDIVNDTFLLNLEGFQQVDNLKYLGIVIDSILNF